MGRLFEVLSRAIKALRRPEPQCAAPAERHYMVGRKTASGLLDRRPAAPRSEIDRYWELACNGLRAELIYEGHFARGVHDVFVERGVKP